MMRVMSSTKKVCPRTGRSPLRRKKNCVLFALLCSVFYGLVQMVQYEDGYVPLRPLSDATSEARRLLKFITHYHYQCNSTVQIGNRSHWPICVERDTGIDLDSHDAKIVYTIGDNSDYMVEKTLALNYSSHIYLIASQGVPYTMRNVNNTHVVKTQLVANDPADFSRNSYGQRTVNDIVQSLRHPRIDLLRLVHVANSVQMWEVVHYMNYDNMFLNVHQFHLAMYIEKLDEDYLYNWYRALYDLFHKEGFRLYHTSSRDGLCLQVTLMQSCIYYLSFIRNPGPKVFVLHPPADFGTSELEEERLLDYVSTPDVQCKQQIIGSPDDQTLHFTTPGQPKWPVCANSVYQLFDKPCSVFRFRSSNDHVLDEKFIQEGCSVYTMEPIIRKDSPVKMFHVHSHQPRGRSRSHMPRKRSLEDVGHIMQDQREIRLIELDLMGYEWEILTHLLDSGILENVTQIVANVQLPDSQLGKHPTVLRSRYSELQRLGAQGFNLFYSSAVAIQQYAGIYRNRVRLGDNCCFKLGFVKKARLYR